METLNASMCGLRRVTIAAVVICLGVAPSCEKPEPPPVAYMGPTLASDQLGVSRQPIDTTSHTLLTQNRSVGRFPGALAVARLEGPQSGLASGPAERATQNQWCVRTIRWEEALAWNKLCNQIPAVREVVVVDRFTTIRPDATLSDIAASAVRLEADLCLVYGPSEAVEGRAGLWGVILDAQTGEKLALVQAQAGPEDFSQPRADMNDRDQRHCDPNYIVEMKFQQEVRSCILDLIALDSPPAATQPSPWRTGNTRPAPVYIVPDRPGRW